MIDKKEGLEKENEVKTRELIKCLHLDFISCLDNKEPLIFKDSSSTYPIDTSLRIKKYEKRYKIKV